MMNEFDKLFMIGDEPVYKSCPECGGEGMVEYERPVIDYVNGGYLEGYIDTCDTCQGDGEIELDYEKDCIADEYGNLYLKDAPQF